MSYYCTQYYNTPEKHLILQTSKSVSKLKNDITIQTLRDNKELLLKQPELLNKIKNLKDKI